MRLFVAAYPPPEALDDLQRCVDGLQVTAAGARVSSRALWHVTLAFLGEVNDGRAPEADRALDRAAEVIGHARPMLRLSGGGRFGRAHFTLLWAGLSGDVAALGHISDRVRRELRASGISYDAQKFKPHLTLARPGARLPEPVIAQDLATLAKYEGPQWTIDAIHLVESHLGPHPRHEIRHSALLAGRS